MSYVPILRVRPFSVCSRPNANLGSLQLAKRPQDYTDRRTDGYTEPLELYILGTSHVSDASAADVRRVLSAVQPQSVVVEVGQTDDSSP